MNNKKETALEILRLWRIDKNLFLECQRRLQEDKAKEILELFRQRNLAATADDLMLALDAQWIFGKMAETQGGGRKARPRSTCACRSRRGSPGWWSKSTPATGGP